MASFARRMGHGLLWVAHNRGSFCLSAWILLLGSALVSFLAPGGEDDWTFRYLPGNFVFLLVYPFAVVAFLGSLVALATKRWASAIFGVVFGGLFLLVTFPPRSPFDDGALSRVCVEEGGCFVLSNAPVFTDTVYDLWHEPEPDSLIWRRFVAGSALNHSEDGSYVDDPELVLSGNRSMLALRRGGHFFDAVDIGGRRVLSPHFSHTQSEEELLVHSAAIAELLERNR